MNTRFDIFDECRRMTVDSERKTDWRIFKQKKRRKILFNYVNFEMRVKQYTIKKCPLFAEGFNVNVAESHFLTFSFLLRTCVFEF